MSLTFAHPTALWLLLLAPLVALAGFRFGVRSRRLARAAVVLRALVVACLALTLAQPLLSSGGAAASTVFVVDRSRSLTEATDDAATDWVNSALKDASSNDRAAVITFGADPQVAAPAQAARSIGSDWANRNPSVQDANYTDIESALALARALPLGGSRRIVLASDGAENVGAALDQASEAARDGIPIDVVPLAGVGEGDLRMDGVTAPSSIWQGDQLNVLASVASGVGGAGTVQLWIDGVLKQTLNETFPAGLASYPFTVKDLTPGFHALDVRVTGDPSIDRYPENDDWPLAVVVRDKPKLLIVAPTGSDPGRLQGALQRQGADVTVAPPTQVSSRLSELGVYDAVLLDNVPAAAFTVDQLAALQQDARTLGRGLIVIGGTSSYGPGNYAGTTLEDTLPVTVKVTNAQQRRRVALLVIIDKSGSMSYAPDGGATKMDMAKEAANVAMQALSNGDTFGVLAFSDSQEWIVPLKQLNTDADRTDSSNAISKLEADGGTEIYPTLAVGLDAIRNANADVRHIILLTDGRARSGTRADYAKLLADAQADHVTVSTIAIGSDADTDLLAFIADKGNGEYHYTEKPAEIPKITLAEAQALGSQAVLRGDFQPIQTQPSPILDGFDPTKLPHLDGYDYAQAKPDAQVVLASGRNDPVLTKWQYGLGRVVAWTADDGADLAEKWAGWPGYDQFWGNMVRWALPDPENQPLQVSVQRDGTEAVLTVNAVTNEGQFVDQAPTTATLTTPSGAVVKNLALYQSGPGQYQRRVSAPVPGAYKVEIHQQRGNQPLDELASFAVPPSPELQPAPGADALLRALAARTGGRVLSLDDPTTAFAGAGLHGSPLRNYRPVWFAPLALALLLLLAELAVRLRFLPRLWYRRR